jgi:hypothetical protein
VRVLDKRDESTRQVMEHQFICSDADEDDIPRDPYTLKCNFNLWTTRSWYGYHRLEEDSITTNRFFKNIYTYKRAVDNRVSTALQHDSNELVDLMLVVLEGEYGLQDKKHRIYVLALAKILHEQNSLLFSSAKRKYLYMDKITAVTLAEIDALKTELAHSTLTVLVSGVALVGFFCYKYNLL